MRRSDRTTAILLFCVWDNRSKVDELVIYPLASGGMYIHTSGLGGIDRDSLAAAGPIYHSSYIL